MVSLVMMGVTEWHLYWGVDMFVPHWLPPPPLLNDVTTSMQWLQLEGILLFFRAHLFFSGLNSQLTSGCIRVKSDSRKDACGGITYSSPISVTTVAWSALFSVTRENKSTCDVQPPSATRDWTCSCSSSSTRGSSLAISQRAARLHSWTGSGSLTVSFAPFR